MKKAILLLIVTVSLLVTNLEAGTFYLQDKFNVDKVFVQESTNISLYNCSIKGDAELPQNPEVNKLYWFVKNTKAYVYDPNFEKSKPQYAGIGFGFMMIFMSMASLLKELWTGEIIKKFRHTGEFLSRIPSRNEFVNNNTIHLVDIGADPEVLINNTTYPIEINFREDEDVPIGLDKFDTTNTAVSDDELYALPYDKKGSVADNHREVLEEKTADKAAHSLAPNINATSTPIVMTTGASNGELYPRKRLTTADIIMAKRKLDDLNVPKKDRILVLCNEHIQDLLLIDESFERQYKDIKEGVILKMYGFDIYEYNNCPKYVDVNNVLTKKAFGAATDPENDQAASFFFYAQRAVQARGSVDMYYSDSKTDPANRRSVVGFRLYHICLPKKTEGFGAIVSSVYTY